MSIYSMASSQAQCPVMPTSSRPEKAETSVFSLSSCSGRRDNRQTCVTVGCPAPLSEHVPDDRQSERRSNASGSTTASRLAEIAALERDLLQRVQQFERREAKWAEGEGLRRSATASQILSFPDYFSQQCECWASANS